MCENPDIILTEVYNIIVARERQEVSKMENNEMTKEEMQKYLNQQAREGKDEIEAYRNLMEVLGIEYPPKGKEKSKDE